MAISISSKGKTLKQDLEEAKLDGNAYLANLNGKQRSGIINAMAACANALDVDGNALHNTSLTMAASLTTSMITVTIS
jgi:hypothetical protein